MASTAGAIRLLRGTRRRQAPPSGGRFDAYEDEYRTILTSLRAATDEPTMDRLLKWAIVEVERTGRLPTPRTMRTEARRLCVDLGVAVPPELEAR